MKFMVRTIKANKCNEETVLEIPTLHLELSQSQYS